MSIQQIKAIAVIGSGKLGTDIFYYLLEYGFDLQLICIDKEEADRQSALFQKKINRQLRAGIIDELKLKHLQDSVAIDCDFDKISQSDLIIECIWEDKHQKKKLFADIAPIIKDNCIVASNSSSINPSLLIPSDKFSDRFLGLHFFYPLRLKNIVEIIKTENTSAENLNTIEDFCRNIGKTFLLLDEENAFVLNKLFLSVQNEAFNIFMEGKLSMREIDSLVNEHLFPGGIFSFFDHVGIDIMLASVKNYIPDAERAPYQSLIQKLEQLVSNNQLGVKTNAGFYNYEKPEIQETEIIHQNHPIYYKEAITRLQQVYASKAQTIVDCGACNAELLEFAAKEYTNADKGPFSLIIQ